MGGNPSDLRSAQVLFLFYFMHILHIKKRTKKKKEKNGEKMDEKNKIKVHISSFSITRICQMSVVSVELLIVVLFIWITQLYPLLCN